MQKKGIDFPFLELDRKLTSKCLGLVQTSTCVDIDKGEVNCRKENVYNMYISLTQLF